MSRAPAKRARTAAAAVAPPPAAPRPAVAKNDADAADAPARTFAQRLRAHIATLSEIDAARLDSVLCAPFEFEDMVEWSLADVCENHEDEEDEDAQLGIESSDLMSMPLDDAEMDISAKDFEPLMAIIAKLEDEKKRLADEFAARFFSDGAAGRFQDTA